MRMLNNNSNLKQSDAAYLTSGKQVANFPSNQFEVASTYGEGNTMVYKGKTRVCNSIVIEQNLNSALWKFVYPQSIGR